MTGRRLYDIYCDEHKRHRYPIAGSDTAHAAVAWPYLSLREQRMWSAMATRMRVKR